MTRTSKTRYALLGQLSVHPASGYQLKKKIEESTAHFWSESYGQIYPELARMEEAGLLSSVEETAEGSGPGVRRVYSITEQGLAELKRWLIEPPSSDLVRDEFLLKMFFGAHLEREHVLNHLDKKIAELKMYAALLTEKGRWILEVCDQHHNDHAPFWLLAVRNGVGFTEGALQELEAMRHAIADGDLMTAHKKWIDQRPATSVDINQMMNSAFKSDENC